MFLTNVPNGLIENALQVALCQGRALEVLLCLDLLGDHDGLFVLDGRHLLLPQRLFDTLIVPQVQLCADEDDGNTRRVVVNLGIPLMPGQCELLFAGREGLAFAFTLSNEGGLTMEKQMRNTSVCGYERGRSLS